MTRPLLATWLPAALYALIAGATLWHHEPWADEAQSWLLARDAGLIDLWTRLLHYEGTPGLWQTLLHTAIALHVPYTGLNIISGLLGLAAACLVWRCAPFPSAIRITLPFTFFLCYQYAVIARSYGLLPLLLFTCAILYRQALPRLHLFTALLSLIAAVSMHGFALSLSVWLALHLGIIRKWSGVPSHDRKRVYIAALVYWTALSLMCFSAWPAQDGTFVKGMNYSTEHLLSVSADTFRQAFTGEWISSTILVLLSIPFLWRGGGLFVFALSSISLCLASGIVYAQVWHQGLLFLGWLFAIWISAANLRPHALLLIALAAIIVVQCYWTEECIRYDWNNNYSGSREAAFLLKESGIARKRLVAIGYACTAVQPYFSRNIFANWNGGGAASYYDWSRRNQSLSDLERLAPLNPDYVLVGYLTLGEKFLWTDSVKRQGFRLVKHFEGNLFWKTEILQPESFDLYQR